MGNYNLTNIFIILIFLIPIIRGIMGRHSANTIKYSLNGILSNIIELISLIVSIDLTRRIFLEQGKGDVFTQIYNAVPKQILNRIDGNDALTYLCSIPVIFFIVFIVLSIATMPLKFLNDKVFSRILEKTLNLKIKLLQYLFRILWGIPKAILYLLICIVLMSFCTYSYPSTAIADSISKSEIYQFLYNQTLTPILNTSLAKKLPVIINDSFKKSFEKDFSQNSNDNSGENPHESLVKNKPNVIKYFNGVTLDSAIKSNAQIDATAKSITSEYKDSKSKAKQIYLWVSKNLTYDKDKAILVTQYDTGIPSGSITAFNTKEGICFDYSCLFISMCRATGLKVRLVTGMGYSGSAWGDHTWNQVFCTEENRWINVDTTFGTVANYFDKRSFNSDHRYGEIQGEW